MTHTLRPNQFSILGIIAGVAVIPIGLLVLLFTVAQMTR